MWCNVCIRHWIWTYLSITQQSQHQAHKPLCAHPPPLNSERKEFVGRLRALVERVAAGESRSGYWIELICSCCFCMILTACCSFPPRQSSGHTKSIMDWLLIPSCVPIITYIQVRQPVFGLWYNFLSFHPVFTFFRSLSSVPWHRSLFGNVLTAVTLTNSFCVALLCYACCPYVLSKLLCVSQWAKTSWKGA